MEHLLEHVVFLKNQYFLKMNKYKYYVIQIKCLIEHKKKYF